MKLACRRIVLASTGTLFVCVLGAVWVGGQSAPEQNPPMAETVFKNIQVLKGIPVIVHGHDGDVRRHRQDCTGCHAPNILVGSRAFAETTPMIQRARQMEMMNTINALPGRHVTCYTCHAARRRRGGAESRSAMGLHCGQPQCDGVHRPPGAANQVDRSSEKYPGAWARRGWPPSRVANRHVCGQDTALAGALEMMAERTS